MTGDHGVINRLSDSRNEAVVRRWNHNAGALRRKILNQMVDNMRRADIVNHMVSNRSASLDHVFHALAHPARRDMLRRLVGGERNLTELAAPLRMSFPAASKHVRVLERARLVRRRVDGRQHLCRLRAAPLKQVTQWTEQFRALWEGRFQELDVLLEEMKSAHRAPARGR